MISSFLTFTDPLFQVPLVTVDNNSWGMIYQQQNNLWNLVHVCFFDNSNMFCSFSTHLPILRNILVDSFSFHQNFSFYHYKLKSIYNKGIFSWICPSGIMTPLLQLSHKCIDHSADQLRFLENKLLFLNL